MSPAELQQLLVAARGDIPAAHASLLGVSVAPWKTDAGDDTTDPPLPEIVGVGRGSL